MNHHPRSGRAFDSPGCRYVNGSARRSRYAYRRSTLRGHLTRRYRNTIRTRAKEIRRGNSGISASHHHLGCFYGDVSAEPGRDGNPRSGNPRNISLGVHGHGSRSICRYADPARSSNARDIDGNDRIAGDPIREKTTRLDHQACPGCAFDFPCRRYVNVSAPRASRTYRRSALRGHPVGGYRNALRTRANDGRRNPRIPAGYRNLGCVYEDALAEARQNGDPRSGGSRNISRSIYCDGSRSI